MRTTNEIIVHSSATRPDWMAGSSIANKASEIRRWHVDDNGWSDIGYHFLIDRDGSWTTGRPVEKAGAHVKGHNAHTIGVCLIGGHGASENDLPFDHFTTQQMAGLRELLEHLQDKYGVTKISGHNDYAAKACPGFDVARWLSFKPAFRTNPAQSTTLQATGVGAAGTATAAVTAVSALDGMAQLVAVVGALIALTAFAWIFRERIKKWAAGDR